MLNLFVYFLLLCLFTNVRSLNLISLGNARIPTKFETVEIDQSSYEKYSKDTSKNITLKYQLNSADKISEEKILLHINDKIENVKISPVPIKGQKIFIDKEILANNSVIYTVRFLKQENAETGKYVLEIKVSGVSYNATSYIESQPLVTKFAKVKLGLEGDPIRISCLFEAYPEVTEIKWERLSSLQNPKNLTFDNSSTIYSDDRVKIIKSKDSKIDNNTLYFTSLTKNDSGLYRCIVVSLLGSDHSVIKINVKDRWAALYPFIGIVIEVIIMVTAILAYEKYQIRSQNKENYSENEEDNKEPSVPLSPRPDDENVPPEADIQLNEMDMDKSNNVDNVKQRDMATAKNV